MNSENDCVEFKIESWKEIENTIKSNTCGIYLFCIKIPEEIRSEMTECKEIYSYLSENWDNRISSRPNIIKKRVKKIEGKIKESDEWIPFYLGKSENLLSRLSEHISGDIINSTTSSLKLEHLDKKSFFYKLEYKYTCVYLEELKEKEYYWIVSEIEKKVRELLHPICGKQ